MQWLSDLGSNNCLLICGTAWFTAQVSKFIINLLLKRKVRFERLYGSGGMPSSHTALVSSLVMSVARFEGVSSTYFALAVAFAGIVIYDAMGVRRQAGEHAKLLNIIIDEEEYLKNEIEDDDDYELKELLGHTPLEVIGGAMVGILVSMLWNPI